MIAVSEKTSKALNKEVLCGQLGRIITALKSSTSATSHPTVKTNMYRFVNKVSINHER